MVNNWSGNSKKEIKNTTKNLKMSLHLTNKGNSEKGKVKFST